MTWFWTTIFTSCAVSCALAAYFAPTIVALFRYRNPAVNLPAVILWNLFAGWLLIGWVLSMAYALRKPKAIAQQPHQVHVIPGPVTRPAAAIDQRELARLRDENAAMRAKIHVLSGMINGDPR